MLMSNATKALSARERAAARDARRSVAARQTAVERAVEERARNLSWRLAQQESSNPHQVAREAAVAEREAEAFSLAEDADRRGLLTNGYCTQDSAVSDAAGPVQQGRRGNEASGTRCQSPREREMEANAQPPNGGGSPFNFNENENDDDSDSSASEDGRIPGPYGPDAGIGEEFLQASECKLLYEEKGNCRKLLMCMALGLQANGRDIGDPSKEPYASATLKQSFVASSLMLKQECKRRAVQQEKPDVKNKYWNKIKCVEWLVANPVTNLADIAWLIATEKELYDVLTAEAIEREAIKKDNANWTTNEPFLRLYLCMCDDKAREALLRKDDILDREALDARNNQYRPPTFYEVVAELYNDRDTPYVTESLPDLHQNFADVLILDLEDMPGGEITADEVKRRFADCRAKLIKVCDGNQ